jgi:hypothetical protein
MIRQRNKKQATANNNSFNIMVSLCACILYTQSSAKAGGACVVSKELGNSLALEWIANAKDTASSAIEKSITNLNNQGFGKKKLRDVHVQATTQLDHGYMIIIKTKYKTPYKTKLGDTRTSYGCGFSAKSLVDAERAAANNLRSYSWGWKSEFGYELHAKHKF